MISRDKVPLYSFVAIFCTCNCKAYFLPNCNGCSQRLSPSKRSWMSFGGTLGSRVVSRDYAGCRREWRAGALRSTSQSMMFERMSEPLISALVTSQKESARLALESVDTECMLLGIIDHPESARKTLQRYKISFRSARKAVEFMFAEGATTPGSGVSAGVSGSKNRWETMLNINRKARDVELPFSPAVKRVLSNAVAVSNSLQSDRVNSEHVLLSLFDYDSKEASIVTRTMGSEEAHIVNGHKYASGAHAVILRIDGVDGESFSKSEFCRTLLMDLQEAEEKGSHELVVGGSQGSKSTPTLSDVGIDLTEAAMNDELDPVFGRDREIKSCLRTLLRRRKNNPCLIGDPGVGKTAIVEGVAQIIAAQQKILQLQRISDRNNDNEVIKKEALQRWTDLAKLCPPKLSRHRLVSIEVGNLVAGTKYRGEFEERIQSLVEELTNPNALPTIVFMDEIHTLIGAGSAEGGIDAANILKPALARGKLQLIGATTVSEYRKCIEKDMALERRLQPLFVKEPSIEHTIAILRGIKGKYESHHDVFYAPKALEAMAKMSERYVNDRFLPDKAIDLLDECGAMAHMDLLSTSSDMDEKCDKDSPIVNEQDVAAVVSEWTGIPTGQLEEEEMTQLLNLEDNLAERVRGQQKAVKAVSRAVRRARSGLRDVSRPIASFLFCGPTGVGKTELCKQLADVYYGSKKNIVRIDMSEYMEKHSVSRLIGSPPGFVGHEEGGQLTEAVRRAPHSVVLLDELEKAHADVLNILLQLMEDGILTDGKGRTVSFKNVILVMTSNIGSRRILDVADKWNKRKMGDVEDSESEIMRTANVQDTPNSEQRFLEMQRSPTVVSTMKEVTFEKDVWETMQTVLNGSPADLIRLGKENTKVADLLKQIWAEANVKASEDEAGISHPDNLTVLHAKEFQHSEKRKHVAHYAAKNAVSAYEYAELSEVVKEDLERTLRPELLNRIDEIVVFSPLAHEEMRSIANLLVEETLERALSEKDLRLTVSSELLNAIIREGESQSSRFGARPIRRSVQRYVEDTLSDVIIKGFLTRGESATVRLGNREGTLVVITRDKDGKSELCKVEKPDEGIVTFGANGTKEEGGINVTGPASEAKRA